VFGKCQLAPTVFLGGLQAICAGTSGELVVSEMVFWGDKKPRSKLADVVFIMFCHFIAQEPEESVGATGDQISIFSSLAIIAIGLTKAALVETIPTAENRS